MDLKETDILGPGIHDHWYYKSKARAVNALLRNIGVRAILDVGAGSGFFSKHLLNVTSAKRAWCVDISYASESDESLAGKQIFYRRSIDAVDADVILMMDVLEHVDDDRGLLCDYVNKVPAGAHVLISVPAFQFLWSGHDDFLEHKRRYTVRQVEDLIRRSDLELIKSCYFFSGVFPIAATIRLVERLARNHRAPKSQLKMHHPLVNSVLTAVCSAELPFMAANRIAGLTVFALARKRSAK